MSFSNTPVHESVSSAINVRPDLTIRFLKCDYQILNLYNEWATNDITLEADNISLDLSYNAALSEEESTYDIFKILSGYQNVILESNNELDTETAKKCINSYDGNANIFCEISGSSITKIK